MGYSQSLPFRGDLSRALQLAEVALTAIGFRITQRSSAAMVLEGPGMNSNRGSPLLGASRIQIQQSGGDLSLDAELGGAERLGRFATLFPLGLVLAIAVVLALVFSFTFGRGPWIYGIFAPVLMLFAVFLVVGPMIRRSIYHRTNQALDALLANMVATGEAKP